MKINTGLVSISFRKLSVEAIVDITKKAGLDAIEWGADVHVRFGDIARAEYVAELTKNAGIVIPEYGSYYYMGASDPGQIVGISESAKTLGCDVVRVWAFNKGSGKATEEEYWKTVEDARRICKMYPELNFCTECHNFTLTDSWESNIKLINDVNMPNFGAFWQPNQLKSFEYNLESARNLARYVRSVHVFSWEQDKKLPLEAHRDRWLQYLKEFKDNGSLNLMLEFMHDDDPNTLDKTAGELRFLAKCLAEYNVF